MNKRNGLITILLVISLLLIHAGMALAAPVKVEALGFFSHPPMWKNQDTIQSVCQQFGNQVELVLHDEMSEDGQNFMRQKGLSGHLPMLLYINGSLAHKIDNRVVVFRDFIGQGWTGQDLEQVIKLNLAGQKTAVKAPPNAETEAWNPSAVPPMMQNAFANAGSGNPSGTGTPLLLYIIGGILILLLIIVIILLLRGKVKAV
ncbi:MAG: hypothetical protein K6U80_19800 [Firmicutes bacterium]|nr:hypothetical protein [Bacillota bacterium]